MENIGLIAYGPVPSRRLGRSLGINNVPAKICSYSCVYCQLGRTINKNIERIPFYNPQNIFLEVSRKLEASLSRNEQIDYLTFVPDGEPTLDINLKKEISILKQLDVSIAVITNSSLLWRKDVREDLLEADLVSIKLDTINEKLWKKIDRPHKHLKFKTVLEGIKEFSEEFNGTIVSETMLIDRIGYNDEFQEIAEFLKTLQKLNTAFIAIPTRPPAEKWVKPPNEDVVNRAFQEFVKILGVKKVEYLIGYEGNAFTFTGNVKEDLLSITSVHPMRKEAIEVFLKKANANWKFIDSLLQEEKIIELEYEGSSFYMRKLPSIRRK